MKTKYLAMLMASLVLLTGCEYAFSDVATRVRYALLEAEFGMHLSRDGTTTITVDPDHWPDGCKKGSGYRLVLSPYKGGKQVSVGDIDVYCNDGHRYYTGFGSEKIYVSRQIAVNKKAGEEVRITLRKTSSGVEIIELK